MRKGVFNINKSTIYSFLIILTIFIASCENVDVSKVSDKDLERISEKAVVCNKPYIRVGIECCLDQNDNKICDKDETKTIQKETEEKSVETTEIIKVQTKQESGKIIKIFVDDTIESFDIWENYIAIIGGEEQHDWAVYLYDIKTQELKQITYDNSRKTHVSIKDNKIYWFDHRYSDSYIFYYDLNEQKETKTNLDVSNYIEGLYNINHKKVYSDNRNGLSNYDVFMNESGKETQITFSQDRSELMPYTHGDYIVYLEQKKDSRVVHLYNIKTKEDKVISNKGSSGNSDIQNSIKVYDGIVVWFTCENEWCANEELYLYII